MQAQFADVTVLRDKTELNFVAVVLIMIGGYVTVAAAALSMCKRGNGNAW